MVMVAPSHRKGMVADDGPAALPAGPSSWNSHLRVGSHPEVELRAGATHQPGCDLIRGDITVVDLKRETVAKLDITSTARCTRSCAGEKKESGCPQPPACS